AGALERVENIAQRLLAAKGEARQRILAGALGEAVVEVGGEEDRRRQDRARRGEAPDDDAEPGYGENRYDADRGEEPEDKATNGAKNTRKRRRRSRRQRSRHRSQSIRDPSPAGPCGSFGGCVGLTFGKGVGEECPMLRGLPASGCVR